MDAISELDKLKILFSKFVNVNNQINVLHKKFSNGNCIEPEIDPIDVGCRTNDSDVLHVSRSLPGDPKIKQDVNAGKSCTNSSASGSSAFGFNYISGDNGDVRVLINEPVSNLASNNLTSHPSISPTKNCTNSSALGSSAFGFNSSSNEDDSGYQNVSTAILPTKSFTNQTALGNSSCALDFVLSNSGNGIGYQNVSIENSAIPSTKNCTNSTCGFNFVSSGNGGDGVLRNEAVTKLTSPSISIFHPTMSPTKRFMILPALGNSMCDFNFVGGGNGSDSIYQNVVEEEDLNLVMDWELPEHSGFHESCLESMLSREDTQQENGYHLVEYFDHLHENFVFDDQITECDLNSSDNNCVNNLEASISSDVDVDEQESDVDVDDSNVAAVDRDIELDTNNTLEEESEIDDDERFRLSELAITESESIRGCDNSLMFVKTSDDVSKKKLCCPYCEKLYSKLPVHMETKHKNEPDVKRLLSFPKEKSRRAYVRKPKSIK